MFNLYTDTSMCKTITFIHVEKQQQQQQQQQCPETL